MAMFFGMRSVCAVLVAGLLVGGCQTTPGTASDENDVSATKALGALLGAGLGALAGSQVGDGKGQLAAIAAGTLLGAWAGSEIGGMLDPADRSAMENATADALERGKGEVEWANPDSGNAGVVRVVDSLDIKPMNKPLSARTSANVRAEPTTTSPVVAGLRAGEAIEAVGNVEGGDWYLVAREGKELGFVHASLLLPVSAVSSAPAAEATRAQTPAVTEAPRTCRVVERTVTLADGRSGREKARFCRGANGWERVEDGQAST